MKCILIFLVTSIAYYSCTEKKESVELVNLNNNEFDAKHLKLPNGKMIDSLKQAHDSCMGVSFDANVILAGAKDSLFVGSILNKQSFKVVSSLSDLGVGPNQMATQSSMVANPCFEKRVLQFPLQSILGKDFSITLPGADETVNKELNDVVASSTGEEMQAGSWVYFDLNNLIKNIADTGKSAAAMEYKKQLLDTSNIVLTAVESIMRVSFIVDAGKDMSEKLQAAIRPKPSFLPPGAKYPFKFYLISPHQFQLSVDGFFPMVGKFMKARLKS